MKKILLMTITLLLLVGCGSKDKKVTCKKEFSDEFSKIVYEDVITYQDNEVLKVNSEMNLTFNEKNDDFSMFEGYANATKEEYNKKNGITSTLKTEDKSIVLSVEYDLKNMLAEEIANYNLDFDIEKIKENYTASGYTCK